MKIKLTILSLIVTLSFICRLGAYEVIMMDLDNDGIPETEVVVMDGITVGGGGDDGPPGGDYEPPEWPEIPEWPDYDPWDDLEYDWNCVDWDEINTSVLFFPINGVGLTMGQDTSSLVGWCQVVNGHLVVMITENNWGKLRDAREAGNDLVANILRESVNVHEENHINGAIQRNPILGGDYDGLTLPEGAQLGSSNGYKSESEYLAHQAQIEFIERTINDGSFNGEDLTSVDEAMLNAALA
ncbi:hypothetical protein, partial [Termitidicoccus mucosus]